MILNKNQKIVLWVALGIIVLMGLFPPWINTMNISNKNLSSNLIKEFAAGYHLIFISPTKNGWTDSDGLWYMYSFSLDYGRLFLQWLMVILVSGTLLYLLREPQIKS
jgi:hypothetical protein